MDESLTTGVPEASSRCSESWLLALNHRKAEIHANSVTVFPTMRSSDYCDAALNATTENPNELCLEDEKVLPRTTDSP